MPDTPYDPAAETDALIVKFVEINPSTGEAVFKNSRYPVWAVVLNLLATDHDEERVHRLFPDLPLAAIAAAERFWQLHPDDIRDRVE